MSDEKQKKSTYHRPALTKYGSLVARTKTDPTVPFFTNEPGKVTPPQGDNPEKKTG